MMSKYKIIKTQIKSIDHVIKALDDMGIPYEVAQEGQELSLYGYQGDRRTETASVVVRQGNVGRWANDIGWTFNAETGVYDLVLSEYDQKQTRAIEICQGVSQQCAFLALQEAALANGFTLTVEDEAGVQRVQVIGGWS